MQRKASRALALSLAAALALPAVTQAAGAPPAARSAEPQPVATLQVSGGTIMLSRDGGPFTSGTSSDPLFSGERLMVAEQSAATVTYHDGCSQTYDKPGVYAIAADCKLAAVTTTGGGMTSGQAIALMAGALVTGGLVGGSVSKEREQVPPVSH